MALGIVLARGGSKGLPRKNALPVAGKPMLAWSLEHALNSKYIERVVLSTDDDELAAIAQSLEVPVVRRPDDLAHDTATVDAAARHCLAQLEMQADSIAGVETKHLAILYGNVPVRPADLTDRALSTLIDTGCDSVQSVYRVGKTHPYWMKTVTDDRDGGALGMYIENNIYRRQELPPVYMLDGGVIALTRAALLTVATDQPHAFLGPDRRAVITEEGAVVDVDSLADLRVAEAILRHLNPESTTDKHR